MDDPSYNDTTSELMNRTKVNSRSTVDGNLRNAGKGSAPFLNYQDMTRLVSKQFANDIKERSKATTPSTYFAFAITFVASGLTFFGILNTFLVILYRMNTTDLNAGIGCLSSSNTIYTNLQGNTNLYWVLVTAGLWCSLPPFLLGMLMECSKMSSPADYSHTFDPMVRGDKKGVAKEMKTFKILTLVSLIVSLPLGFICAAIDVAMSYVCVSNGQSEQIKFVAPLCVCLVSVVVFILVLLNWRKLQKQNSKNDNYDKRSYALRISHTYNNVTSAAGTPATATQPEVADVPAPPSTSAQAPLVAQVQPVTLTTAVPPVNYGPVLVPPLLPPPPPPAPVFYPRRPGPVLPVRAVPYRRPMFYQMPNFYN